MCKQSSWSVSFVTGVGCSFKEILLKKHKFLDFAESVEKENCFLHKHILCRYHELHIVNIWLMAGGENFLSSWISKGGYYSGSLVVHCAQMPTILSEEIICWKFGVELDTVGLQSPRGICFWTSARYKNPWISKSMSWVQQDHWRWPEMFSGCIQRCLPNTSGDFSEAYRDNMLLLQASETGLDQRAPPVASGKYDHMRCSMRVSKSALS